MEPEKNVTVTYRDYGELWNYNLQKIEQIQHLIEKSIHDLENKYADFDSRYEEIMQELDILSSIYSAYNTIQGLDYVLRLKSVIESYRRRYTREGLNFNLIHYLLIKISDTRDDCFENFPDLSHQDVPVIVSEGNMPENEYSRRKYKWITFERNRSWFIAPFMNVDIMKNENYPVVSVEEPDYLNVDINNNIVKIKDIFVKSLTQPDNPYYFILLNNELKNFAANRIGKRIYAKRNIINPFIKPFKKVHAHPLSPGRIRLFGKNHILLN